MRIAVKELLNKSCQIVLDLGRCHLHRQQWLGRSGGPSARNAGADIKLANLSPHLKDMLQITKLFTVFEVFDRAEDAAAVSKAAGA